MFCTVIHGNVSRETLCKTKTKRVLKKNENLLKKVCVYKILFVYLKYNLKLVIMEKKYVIVKHLSFSDKDCYYCENGGNLDNGLYHGSKFKSKLYNSKEECEQFIPELFEIELNHWDGHTQVAFSIEEIYVKL